MNSMFYKFIMPFFIDSYHVPVIKNGSELSIFFCEPALRISHEYFIGGVQSDPSISKQFAFKVNLKV